MGIIWRRKIQTLAITSFAFASLLGLTASQSMAQDDPNTFSKEVPEQTITFPSVNPYTKVSGSMTIVFSGVFHATRLTEPMESGISRITGGQRGTFTFTPDGSSQPTMSGGFRFTLSGNTQRDTGKINFAFVMEGMAQDGSAVSFVQTETAVISEAACDISFGSTDPVGPANN